MTRPTGPASTPASTPGASAVGSVLVGADVLRGAALVSVVAGAASYGWVGFALFFLVLGATMLPRALGAPAALDASYCLSLLLGAWAAQLDWYLAISWLDLVAHAVATGLIAAMAHLALVLVGAVPALDGPSRLPRGRLGAGVLTATAGVTLALVWELLEWAGHTWVDERIQVGYADTLGDLAAGSVGAVVAGVLVARGVLARTAR